MTLTRELPRYQCHKQVQALKIRTIIQTPGGFELHFDDTRFAPHLVGMDWIMRHVPMIGGYLVVYEDGYQSFSPADVFEAGYTLIDEQPQAERGRGYRCVGGPHDGEWMVRPDGQTRFAAVLPPKPLTSVPGDMSAPAAPSLVSVDYVLQEHPIYGMAWVCTAA